MVWPALIAAGGALVGGLINKSSQKKTNAANVQAVTDTNAANRELALENNKWNAEQVDKQNQWNAEQIRLQNEYNSPANMAKLYEEAGFNPLIGVGMGTALQTGAALGGAASGTVIPGVAPQITAAGMGDSIAQAGLFAADGYREHQALLAANNAADQRMRALEKENQKLRMSGPQQSIVGQLSTTPSGVTVTQAPVGALQDTRAPVELVDALSGQVFSVPFGVAQALGKKEGEYFIAEDLEALVGDVAGEAYAMGAITLGASQGYTAIRPSTQPMADYTPQRSTHPFENESRERTRRALTIPQVDTTYLPQRGR